MNKISTDSARNEAASPHRVMKQVSVAPKFRLTRTLPRVVTGLTATVAGLSAAFFIFGPLSDRNAMQLAFGPNGSALDVNGKPIALSSTAGPRGADEEQRASAPFGVSLAKLESANATGAEYGPGRAK